MDEAQLILQTAVDYLNYLSPILIVIATLAFADVIFSFLVWLVMQARKGVRIKW